jgi:hypothetical protein
VKEDEREKGRKGEGVKEDEREKGRKGEGVKEDEREKGRKGEGEKENLVIIVGIAKFDYLVAKIFYYENP